jgi:hypothetical protein
MVSELQGDPGHPLGQFGAAITALADINGDGLMDVAVGAPLEAQGAVYIFSGQSGGLSPRPSQVRCHTCPLNSIPGTWNSPSPTPSPWPDFHPPPALSPA